MCLREALDLLLGLRAPRLGLLGLTRLLCHYIDDHLPAILAAGRTGAMRRTHGAAFALGGARRNEGVVAAAIGRVRTGMSHSYYHEKTLTDKA